MNVLKIVQHFPIPTCVVKWSVPKINKIEVSIIKCPKLFLVDLTFIEKLVVAHLTQLFPCLHKGTHFWRILKNKNKNKTKQDKKQPTTKRK